ncbi:WD domain [Trypanosoma vivax]|uniref:Guanine nucleotide-binding protein subunit beta-like protein n=1 Tax=Trypanosoma vivax (strain Y486) TaxID=1055687 RepID=G0U5R9_TRYVY|nr:WD domain [Trypanosoma vivax]CCC51220.1 conserved hypothetical protein [Trypanosoma vivax Y486]
MLSKKRAERAKAISAIALAERKKGLLRLKHRREVADESLEASSKRIRGQSSLESEDDVTLVDPFALSAEDPSAMLRAIGDHVNTRLQELDFGEDIDADLFEDKQRQLREEAEMAQGTRVRNVASEVAFFLGEQQRGQLSKNDAAAASVTQASGVTAVRVGHNSNAVTAVSSLGPDTVVLGDKTGSVYIVDLGVAAKGKELLAPRLPAAVLSLAVSDTRGLRPSQRSLFERTTADTSVTSYIAAGTADGAISVWVTETRRHMGVMTMHRSAVTGLTFRNDTLYSCSTDGTLRVWALPQMSCEDRLFGHAGSVLGIHALRRERCASVGDDGTMRFWKVDAATQQEFSASTYFDVKVVLECVVMLSDNIILCGAVNGALLVFDVGKRRPVVVREAAHGYGFTGDGTGLEREAIALQQKCNEGNHVLGSTNPNPITAVAAIPYSDLAASASYDGAVRLWHLSVSRDAGGRLTKKGEGATTQSSPAALECLISIPVHAIVTSLYFPPTGDVLVVACSKEPRLGRWVVQSRALNGAYVVPLNGDTQRAISTRSHVEHIPAQLFGFKDDEDGEGDSDSSTEAVAVPCSDSDNGCDGRVPSQNAKEDVLGCGFVNEEDANDGDLGTSLFTIGEDGQMVFDASLGSSGSGCRKGKVVGKKKRVGRGERLMSKGSAAAVEGDGDEGDAFIPAEGKKRAKVKKNVKKNNGDAAGEKGKKKKKSHPAGKRKGAKD